MVRHGSALLLMVGAIVVGCVGVQVGTKPTVKSYEFASYWIDVPSGDWGVVEVDYKEESIEFQRASYAVMAGRVTSQTKLSVMRADVLPEKWAEGPEAVANGVRDQLEQNLVKDAARQSYELKNVRKGVTEIGGKKLYSMSHEGGVGNWFVGGERYESVQYLYFPPDYSVRHAFYVFTLSTISVKGSIYSESANEKLLEPFLAGFRLKEPTAAKLPSPPPPAGWKSTCELTCPDGRHAVTAHALKPQMPQNEDACTYLGNFARQEVCPGADLSAITCGDCAPWEPWEPPMPARH